MPIVGLEPSSLLTLRDEYLYLLPGDAQVPTVGRPCLHLRGIHRQTGRRGRTESELHRREARHILLHGHCHQKALVGTGPSHRVLSLPPNYTVRKWNRLLRHGRRLWLRSGACRHFAANGRAPPAAGRARRHVQDTLIVAAGSSCRQQIKHGTQRRALHPAEVLRDALQ